MIEVIVWGEGEFLPVYERGPCKYNDAEKCTLHHLNRQGYFVMKCMAEFKTRNKTWVLLVDRCAMTSPWFRLTRRQREYRR